MTYALIPNERMKMMVRSRVERSFPDEKKKGIFLFWIIYIAKHDFMRNSPARSIWRRCSLHLIFEWRKAGGIMSVFTEQFATVEWNIRADRYSIENQAVPPDRRNF